MAPLQFTPEALAFVQAEQARAPNERRRLWVGVRRHGCAGYAYTLSWEAPADQAKTHQWTQAGLPLGMLERDVPWLRGTEVALEAQALGRQLVWHNPQAQEACGCGRSVQLHPAEP